MKRVRNLRRAGTSTVDSVLHSRVRRGARSLNRCLAVRLFPKVFHTCGKHCGKGLFWSVFA